MRALVAPIDRFDVFGRGLLAGRGELERTLTLLRGHEIGSIRVASGRIAVADPYLLHHARPLDRRCPVGTFPVIVGEAEQDGGVDTAGLCVRFRDVRPATWETVGTVSVDSASLVVVDAAHAREVHELATRTGALPLPLGHALFRVGGTAVAAGSLVGSDGGYPVLWGLDDAGQPVSLCVPIAPPDRYTRWQPPARCPPLPDLFDVEACTAWAAAIPGYDGSLGYPGAVTREALAELERFAGGRAPLELRAFYRCFSPWQGDGLEAWRALAVASGHGAGRGAFPLSASRDFADALVPVGERLAVRTIDERGAGAFWRDIPSWLVLHGISLFDLTR